MPVKLKIASNAHRPATLGSNLLRAALVLGLVCVLVFAGIFGYYYFKYQKIVDQRLAAGPLFANAAQIYAAPQGGPHRPEALGRPPSRRTAPPPATTRTRSSAPIASRGDSIFVKPGPQTYHSTDGATITTGADDDGSPQVTAITAENGAAAGRLRARAPAHHRALQDKSRTKRRVIPYNEIPPQHGAGRHRHRGPPLLRARRRQLHAPDQVRRHRRRHRPQGLRRIHADPAARQEHLPHAGKELPPQARRAASSPSSSRPASTSSRSSRCTPTR